MSKIHEPYRNVMALKKVQGVGKPSDVKAQFWRLQYISKES